MRCVSVCVCVCGCIMSMRSAKKWDWSSYSFFSSSLGPCVCNRQCLCFFFTWICLILLAFLYLSARVEDIVCSLITLAFMVNMFGNIEFRCVSRTTCRNNQDIPNHLQTELVRQQASQFSEPSSRRASIGVSIGKKTERRIGSRSDERPAAVRGHWMIEDG